jgi:hypothetical protein
MTIAPLCKDIRWDVGNKCVAFATNFSTAEYFILGSEVFARYMLGSVRILIRST